MKILNFGSLNIDYVYDVPCIVSPGETIPAEMLHVYPGGKGLNQSLAAARAGAEVIHAGAIGPEGDFLAEILAESGVDVGRLLRVQEPCGHAMIQVDRDGQNSIVVFGGANRALPERYIDDMLALGLPGDIVLMQNETNGISRMMRSAKENGFLVAWNPSPMPDRVEDFPLECVDYLIVNEVEGAHLAGMEQGSDEAVLQALSVKYPSAAIVLTLGSRGVLWQDGDSRLTHGAFSVQAVDTTAAGDTFCGYFLAGLCREVPIGQCLRESSAAAAIAVSKKGAASSIPLRSEVVAFLEER